MQVVRSVAFPFCRFFLSATAVNYDSNFFWFVCFSLLGMCVCARLLECSTYFRSFRRPLLSARLFNSFAMITRSIDRFCVSRWTTDRQKKTSPPRGCSFCGLSFHLLIRSSPPFPSNSASGVYFTYGSRAGCFFRRYDTLQVIASWIYSASTLHAAVNFPQKPSMSFVPSCPGSMFAPPPTDKVNTVVVVVAVAFAVAIVCCYWYCCIVPHHVTELIISQPWPDSETLDFFDRRPDTHWPRSLVVVVVVG